MIDKRHKKHFWLPFNFTRIIQMFLCRCRYHNFVTTSPPMEFLSTCANLTGIPHTLMVCEGDCRNACGSPLYIWPEPWWNGDDGDSSKCCGTRTSSILFLVYAYLIKWKGSGEWIRALQCGQHQSPEEIRPLTVPPTNGSADGPRLVRTWPLYVRDCSERKQGKESAERQLIFYVPEMTDIESK